MPRPGLLDVIACAWDLDRDVSSWLADLSDCSARVLPGVEGAVCWLSRVGEEGPQLVAAEGQGDLLAWMMRDHEGGLEEGALDACEAHGELDLDERGRIRAAHLANAVAMPNNEGGRSVSASICA